MCAVSHDSFVRMVKVDMERFPGFTNDLQFVERLVSEQSVFALPGRCFNYPNYIRIVLTVPARLLSEACLSKWVAIVDPLLC